MATTGASSPCPVKLVAQFEADAAIAAKLQQQFDDENHAAEVQEIAAIDDEFAAATERLHREQSERYLKRVQDAK